MKRNNDTNHVEDDPFEVEAESSSASSKGLVELLESITATIEYIPDSRYEVDLTIREKESAGEE